MSAFSLRNCTVSILLSLLGCGGTTFGSAPDGSACSGASCPPDGTGGLWNTPPDGGACVAQVCPPALPYWSADACRCVSQYPGSSCSVPQTCAAPSTWDAQSCSCRVGPVLLPPDGGGTGLLVDASSGPPACALPQGGFCSVGSTTCPGGPCSGPGGAPGELSCSCTEVGPSVSSGSCVCLADAGIGPVCGGISCGNGTTLDPVSCACTGGTPPPTTCTVPGFGTCQVNTYCDYGICPDGKTPYGCYCQSNGVANCSNNCPTTPLDASVACYIPNYGYCAPATECIIGTCPDGVTPVKCFCMADGTAQCTGGCPPPADAGHP